MEGLIAPFDFKAFVLQPWQDDPAGYGWIVLMAFLVTLSCGLIGNYLVLRRMSLVGDAISHSVLPGIAVAFLVSHSRDPWIMSIGAIAAGVLTTFLIENIHVDTFDERSQNARLPGCCIVFFYVRISASSAPGCSGWISSNCLRFPQISSIDLKITPKIFRLRRASEPPGFPQLTSK